VKRVIKRIVSGKYAIIGFPWDMGASLGRPGARYAPKAIRDSLKWILNRVKDNKVFDIESNRVVDLSQVIIKDVGDIEIFAHDTFKTFNTAYMSIKNLIIEGFNPVIIGGDHSISYPCIKALHDSVEGTIGIVQFDAHLDLVDETPFQGKFSHSSEIRRALELERVKRVIQIGVRGYNYPFHYDDVRKFNIMQFSSYDVRKLGASIISEKVLKELNNIDYMYITLDIDVLDPSFAPGCGANEPGGLTIWDLIEILKKLAPYSHAFDIVEVNPLFDTGGITSSIAAKLLFDYIIYHFNPI
jgi:formiminoglutamase/agmatinase